MSIFLLLRIDVIMLGAIIVMLPKSGTLELIVVNWGGGVVVIVFTPRHPWTPRDFRGCPIYALHGKKFIYFVQYDNLPSKYSLQVYVLFHKQMLNSVTQGLYEQSQIWLNLVHWFRRRRRLTHYHTIPTFTDPQKRSLLKTLREKEKILVTSIFSFSPQFSTLSKSVIII